jgi:hypothetical protein
MAPPPMFDPRVFTAAAVVAALVLGLVALGDQVRASRHRTRVLVVATTVVDGEVVVDGVVVDDDSPLGPRGWPVTVRLGAGHGAVAVDRVVRVGPSSASSGSGTPEWVMPPGRLAGPPPR